MRIAKTPKLAEKVFPKLTWNKKEGENCVYLTFDDGPTPGITEWVLSTLNSYNAKGTFFCLGKNVVLYPDIYNEIVQNGHSIGNHTYHHMNAWKTNKEAYLEDIANCEKVFHSTLFRPPYGKLRPGIRRKILENYRIIMWDVLSYDFDNTISEKACLNNVLKHTSAGSIIVFHDSKKAAKNLKYTLPKTLDWLKENGLKTALL